MDYSQQQEGFCRDVLFNFKTSSTPVTGVAAAAARAVPGQSTGREVVDQLGMAAPGVTRVTLDGRALLRVDCTTVVTVCLVNEILDLQHHENSA